MGGANPTFSSIFKKKKNEEKKKEQLIVRADLGIEQFFFFFSCGMETITMRPHRACVFVASSHLRRAAKRLSLLRACSLYHFHSLFFLSISSLFFFFVVVVVVVVQTSEKSCCFFFFSSCLALLVPSFLSRKLVKYTVLLISALSIPFVFSCLSYLLSSASTNATHTHTPQAHLLHIRVFYIFSASLRPIPHYHPPFSPLLQSKTFGEVRDSRTRE